MRTRPLIVDESATELNELDGDVDLRTETQEYLGKYDDQDDRLV